MASVPEYQLPYDLPGISDSSVEAVRFSPEHPTASYETYRAACDFDTDGFRKIGLQDPEAYTAAMCDPKTVRTVINGEYMPLMAPIMYEDRYQADRCKELMGADDVLLLTVPLQRIYEGVAMKGQELTGGAGLSSNFSIVVEEHENSGDHESPQAAHEYLASLMGGVGDLAVGEFEHPSLRHRPENRTAWMGIFNFSFQPTEAGTIPLDMPPRDALEAAWAMHCEENDRSPLPTEGANGTFILTSQQLREHPEIVDALWRISEVGFGKVLGAYHPISMEVTREFFEESLLTDGVYTPVHYYDGQPVCFGTFALDMGHNEWIDCNSTVMRQDIEAAAQRGETVGHFFELISNGPQGMSFSPFVIGLLTELAGKTGRPYHLYFESTNLSARYIPRIVRSSINENTNLILTQDVQMIGRLHYWYLKHKQEQLA